MEKKDKLEDLRKNKRINVQYGSVAALENRSGVKIGLITDISKNGLSFCYLDHETGGENDQKESLKPIISVDVKDFYLDKVPCEIVSDQNITRKFSFCTPPMKKCRIQFRELTSDQASNLDNFIEGFTIDSSSEPDK